MRCSNVEYLSMLSELQISNFAIIEHQSVTFTRGLNVISGETGAGKSIILHAIELILGGRPKPHMLRDGAVWWSCRLCFLFRVFLRRC